ncbi:cop9 subunit [Xylaria bambusicola]|uniref:cop9 subunit n=1 Tax=Xylaria bambusicola TaxID=326684 RepID=UPI002008D652|nr:cop9 subunit [Xylaria bambusicola]KAI0521846.1 cop9 subunit [Xylaria bambusicola]
MDQCADVLLAFSPPSDLTDNEAYHKAALIHTQRLSKLLKERSKELVTFSKELLNVVDPSYNSLSYLAILHAVLIPSPAAKVEQEFVLDKLVTFMMLFDGRQCRYGGLNLLDIMEAVGSGRLLPPSVAVKCLASAILRLDPSGAMLTSSHLILARLAYDTDNIQPALPVIDKPIVYYPGAPDNNNTQYLCDLELPPPSYISKSTGLTSQLKTSLVLEYDLIRGMMYCERRDWRKARDAFEGNVTYPARDGGCSKIMVDSFKKWILVNLLANGRHGNTPSRTNASTSKIFGLLGRPYVSLATAFTTDDVEQLRLEAQQNAQVWMEDGNAGLVEEVMASYQKWRVLSLQDIYTKISIAEIRQMTKSAETGFALSKDEDVEALIQNMIIAAMLNGVIEKNDDGTKFLQFLSPTAHSEADVAREMKNAAAIVHHLRRVSASTDHRLGHSKEFIKFLMKEAKREKSGETQDPTLGFETLLEDEDLMGDSMNV